MTMFDLIEVPKILLKRLTLARGRNSHAEGQPNERTASCDEQSGDSVRVDPAWYRHSRVLLSCAKTAAWYYGLTTAWFPWLRFRKSNYHNSEDPTCESPWYNKQKWIHANSTINTDMTPVVSNRSHPEDVGCLCHNPSLRYHPRVLSKQERGSLGKMWVSKSDRSEHGNRDLFESA